MHGHQQHLITRFLGVALCLISHVESARLCLCHPALAVSPTLNACLFFLAGNLRAHSCGRPVKGDLGACTARCSNNTPRKPESNIVQQAARLLGPAALELGLSLKPRSMGQDEQEEAGMAPPSAAGASDQVTHSPHPLAVGHNMHACICKVACRAHTGPQKVWLPACSVRMGACIHVQW